MSETTAPAVARAAIAPYLALAGAVIAADQATKLWAHAALAGREPVVVIPGLFDLAYSTNAGGLFGMFRDLSEIWRMLLLTVLPLGAVALIVLFLRGTDAADRRTRIALGLILGGALGNLIDRLLRGEVVDFLDVYVSHAGLARWLVERFGTAHWPTFNLADSSIVTGALLLLTTIVLPPRAQRSP